LAGGILQQGYQCGMLWGASMAVGAEAYRRCNDVNKAIALAIVATQHIIEAFEERNQTSDCYDITEADFASKKDMMKYMISGKFLHCFKLAEKWAPEAVEAANRGLSTEHYELPANCTSCASEVVKRLGASEEEMVMVAGFAGGLGLSGNGCGALSAAIWMDTLNEIVRKGNKPSFSNPRAEKILAEFYNVSDYEMRCDEICGKQFNSLDEHTRYINEGGCTKVMDMLANVNKIEIS